MESVDIDIRSDENVLKQAGQVGAMPAGPELNDLIQQKVFKSTPLTDNEFALLRVWWEMTMPSWASQKRPFKVQLTPREIEGRKYEMSRVRPQDPEVFATYRLQYPQDYSGDRGYADIVVWKMRADGWLYEMRDMDEGRMRNVKFRRAIWREKEYAGEIGGQGFAGTDGLAICRAAIVAMIELDAATARGCHVELPYETRLATEDASQ